MRNVLPAIWPYSWSSLDIWMTKLKELSSCGVKMFLQRSAHLFIPARVTFGFFSGYFSGYFRLLFRLLFGLLSATFLAEICPLIHSCSGYFRLLFPRSPIWPWNRDASLIPALVLCIHLKASSNLPVCNPTEFLH